MSASPTSYRTRGPGMLIEMARRGIYARQTIVPLLPSTDEPVPIRRCQGTSSSGKTLVEAAGFDFTPPRHDTVSSGVCPSYFDNVPPDMTQQPIKGAFFGLPYAQRYNSRNRSETTVHEPPLASLHVAPATISYKAGQCSSTRCAGRIELSLRHTPKLGRAVIKVADFFQARSRNACNRAEPPAAFGEDAFRRYSQKLSRWQMAGEDHGCRQKSEFRHTQVPALPAVALQANLEDLSGQDGKGHSSGARRGCSSPDSTTSAKRSSRVVD
ncbi:hypothetical protein GGI24_005699, partial [Coemansia furcata]